MKLNKNLREFIELLNSERVDYLLVGGHCLAFHGAPRFTGDIDFFVRVSEPNAQKLEQVIRQFGFAATGLTAADFLSPDQVIQLGISPNRIDLLTAIDGVKFEEAWNSRIQTEIDGLPVFMLSREMLIQNKVATGRLQDQADVERLLKSKT